MKLLLLFVNLFCLSSAHWWKRRPNRCKHADFKVEEWQNELRRLTSGFVKNGDAVHCEMESLDEEWPHVEPAAPTADSLSFNGGLNRLARQLGRSPRARFTVSDGTIQDNFQAAFPWKQTGEKFMCMKDAAVEVKLLVSEDPAYSMEAETSFDPDDVYVVLNLEQKNRDGMTMSMSLRCIAELRPQDRDIEDSPCRARSMQCRGRYEYTDYYKTWNAGELRNTPMLQNERFNMRCYADAHDVVWESAPDCGSETETPEDNTVGMP